MNLTIRTNVGEVAARLMNRFVKAQDKDKMLRSVAVSLLPEVRHRIHQDGKAADGSDIGTYEESYMPTRRKNNRGESRKKIYSLTSKLENSLVVVADGTRYGIGVLDATDGKGISSIQKIKFNEQRDGKKSYALAQGEVQLGITVAKHFLSDALHG